MLFCVNEQQLKILTEKWQHCLKWVAVLLMAASSSYGAEYFIDPQLDVSATYNDNATLTSVSEQEVHLKGSKVTPQAVFGINTEVLVSELDIKLDFKRYDLDEWNTNNQNIGYFLSQKFDKQTLIFNAGYIRDTTRNSEFSSSGIATTDRHERYTAGFVWDYLPTNRVFARINLNWSEDEYEDPDDRFSDSETYTLSVLGGYQLSEKLSVNLSSSSAKTDFEQIEQRVEYSNGTVTATPLQTALPETEQNSISIGVTYRLSEIFSFDASLGKTNNIRAYEVLRTDFTNTNGPIMEGDTACDGGVLGVDPTLTRDLCSESATKTDRADISLDYEGLRNTMSLAYNESTKPSSDGSIFNGKTLDFTWNFKISEKQALKTNLNYGENETVHQVTQFVDNDRTYMSATVVHFYKVLKNWNIRSSYIYREQQYDREVGGSSSNSNAIAFGIVYSPEKSSWSR